MRAVACVVVWVLATTASVTRAEVTRAPYLQSVSHERAVVRWQTDLASALDSRVRFGSSPAALGSSATSTAAVSAHDSQRIEHSVVLNGLGAATRYYYDVGTQTDGVQAGGTAEDYVVTAPLPGTPGALSVLVFGDAGTGGSAQLTVRNRMLAVLPAPDLVLTLGDIAYDDGTSGELSSRFFAVYQSVFRHAPLWPAVGNHEASDGVSDSPTQSGPYFEAFALPSAGQAGGVPSSTEAYYAFDHGIVHFIVLDSDDSSTAPGSAQLTWLAADLAAVPRSRQWIVVAFHHPPYSKGSHDSDSFSDSAGRMVRMREHVAPLLEAGGADLVLAGHSHSYERSYLIDRAYGYGSAPTYATPSLGRLTADGRIVDASDGDPSGDGPYAKDGGAYAHGGTLYVVSGHGGANTGGALDHPVMAEGSLSYGFTRLDIDETMLTLTSIRADGTLIDRVRLQKPAMCEVPADCDDEDLCTDDLCVAQRCQYAPAVCDDADACTIDSCDPTGGCTSTVLDCGDGDACITDSCDPGIGCQHAAVNCADGNACTADACDSNTGCGYLAITCADGNACTTDGCDPASGCAFAAIACDDGNACTTDGCDPASGCAYAAVACDDGNACTTDTCDVSTGCTYAALDCDDGDVCTMDACDTVLGCGHTALACAADAGTMSPDAAVSSPDATVPRSDAAVDVADGGTFGPSDGAIGAAGMTGAPGSADASSGEPSPVDGGTPALDGSFHGNDASADAASADAATESMSPSGGCGCRVASGATRAGRTRFGLIGVLLGVLVAFVVSRAHRRRQLSADI